MEIKDLVKKFSTSKENQMKAIFSTLFIASNRLQTLFDKHIPDVSLKQFMLLTIVRQSKQQLTFTQLGGLLGCSRQNIKKLAAALEKKNYITIQQSPADSRALCICAAAKMHDFFENVFSAYQSELAYLFEVYIDDEIALLFGLLTKLYDGIDHLEKSADKVKEGENICVRE